MFAALFAASLAFATPGDALAKLPFPAAWKLNGAYGTVQDRNGAPVIQLEGAHKREGAKKSSATEMSVVVNHPPTDQNMDLTIWMKGQSEGQWIRIVTTATKKVGGKTVFAESRVMPGPTYVTTEYVKVTKDWKPYTKTLIFSRSAQAVEIRIENRWKESLWVSSPSMRLGRKEMCDLDGPGVIRCNLRLWVKPVPGHKGGHISFPVPMVYRDQAPLAIRLTSQPAGVLGKYEFVERPDGRNWMCEAEVAPSSKPSYVNWEALVYVRDCKPAQLPKVFKPEVPKEAAEWTESSTCVQTGDTALIEQAKKLSADNPDIETYARRVARFSCENLGTGSELRTLDAKAAMSCGGSCTSRANLAAALLRERGIPARTVAHLPTWNYGNALFTHWLVEYWHPGVGWIWLESALGEFEPQPYTVAILAISSKKDEDGSFDPVFSRWLMPGAPEWSFARIDRKVDADNTQNNQLNWARPEKRMAGSQSDLDRLFLKATRSYDGLARSKRYSDPRYFLKIEKAMASGKASNLSGVIGR